MRKTLGEIGRLPVMGEVLGSITSTRNKVERAGGGAEEGGQEGPGSKVAFDQTSEKGRQRSWSGGRNWGGASQGKGSRG